MTTLDNTFLTRPTIRTERLDKLRARFAPIFEEIAAGALERELSGELPTEAVDRLKRAGFGAVRVPEEFGGGGATLPGLTQLWIDLVAADANLAQALRGHFAFAEDRLWHHHAGTSQETWFERFVSGEIAGNAWSEVGSTTIDTQQTVLAKRSDGTYVLNGSKYYTTGTIFAEWADVYALLEEPPGDGVQAEGEKRFVIAITDTRENGVTTTDDWAGFGQLGTGSGTTTFENVTVQAENVLPFGERYPYQTALYQLNLLATLAGIARAATADTVEAVRARERNYSHANAARVRDDPQVLARVGEIASAAYVVEAATIRTATALQENADLAGSGDREAIAAANELAEIESSAAQVVVTEQVLTAVTNLFDTLGASGTERERGLDRHWRNARTVSSHNPRILKAKVVGAHLVNGTPPPYAWAIGTTSRPAAT